MCCAVPWKYWKGRLTVWDSCTGSPSCFVVAETAGEVETAWIVAAAVDGGGEAAVDAAAVVSSLVPHRRTAILCKLNYYVL